MWLRVNPVLPGMKSGSFHVSGFSISPTNANEDAGRSTPATFLVFMLSLPDKRLGRSQKTARPIGLRRGVAIAAKVVGRGHNSAPGPETKGRGCRGTEK